MSIIQELDDKMSSSINTSDELYEVVFGKLDFTPQSDIEQSSDYNCGAIADEFEYHRAYSDSLSKRDDIDEFTSSYLDMIIGIYTKMTRITAESDAAFKNRFYSFIRRRNNKRWNTTWSIIDVFSYFVDRDHIFIEENYVLINLLLNFDFETAIGAEWTISNNGGSSIVRISDGNQFQESYAAKITSDGTNVTSISQSVASLAAGTYGIGFMLNDDIGDITKKACEVRVQRSSDSKYWNDITESWQVGAIGKQIPSAPSYRWIESWFKTTGTETIMISVRNVVASGSYHAWFDLIEMGVRSPDPHLKVILQFSGQAGAYMSLTDGGADPIGSYDYPDLGYLDSSFIGGSGVGITTDIFSDLLQKVKAAGVFAGIVLINKAV